MYSNSNIQVRNLQLASPLHASAVHGDKSTLQKLIEQTNHVEQKDLVGRTPLIYAVLGQSFTNMELLHKAGADINAVDETGKTALHWATQKNMVSYVKWLLSKGSNWKMSDCEGITALHLATKHKNSKCLSAILKYCTSGETDLQDNQKKTALHWAAITGNYESLQLLVKHKSNVCVLDKKGKIPLHYVASCREPSSVEMVKILLTEVPSTLNWTDYDGHTPLHLAVSDGLSNAVKELVSNEKCDVCKMDNNFHTPLHLATLTGQVENVIILFNLGKDLICCDVNGATPLHYAAMIDNADMIRAYLESCTCTGLERDVNSRTPLMWAAGKGADQSVKEFCKNKSNIELADINGATALHVAALEGNASTVVVLLNMHANVDSEDNLNRTPLCYACEMAHLEIVCNLVKYGASLDRQDHNKRTPLHWASIGGHPSICQKLIESGINPNIKDIWGRTALHLAAFYGNIDCIWVLICHGATPEIQDNEGMTPLHWACRQGNYECVKSLTEYGNFNINAYLTDNGVTPLDIALIHNHRQVVHYLLENGGLSIEHIQERAAVKIQSFLRGCLVRKRLKIFRRSSKRQSQMLRMLEKLDLDSSFNQEMTQNSEKVCTTEVRVQIKPSDATISVNEDPEKNIGLLTNEQSLFEYLSSSNGPRTIKENTKKFTNLSPRQIDKNTEYIGEPHGKNDKLGLGFSKLFDNTFLTNSNKIRQFWKKNIVSKGNKELPVSGCIPMNNFSRSSDSVQSKPLKFFGKSYDEETLTNLEKEWVLLQEDEVCMQFF